MPLPELDARAATSSAPGFGSGRGRSHGTSNREPFDRWFRYPAGFASDYVSLLLDRLKLTEGTVIDCFAGSGVTGTAARARGLSFEGIEAHPMVAELAQLKLTPQATSADVRALASEIAKRARQESPAPMGPDSSITQVEPTLIQRSFTEETLLVLVTLRRLIKERLSEPAALYLKWALLATLRDVADVKVGWPYQRPGIARTPRHTDPVKRFELRAHIMADDLASLDERVERSSSTANVIVGDSRDPNAWRTLTPGAVACIASPPYLNNFDYADATRLELFFWGDIQTWAEMCREVRSDMLTATTQQSSVREKKSAINTLEHRSSKAPELVKELLHIVDEINDAKRIRDRRSKEYDQVAPAYFLAMWDILTNLSPHMEPGAEALWLIGDSAPYGVYVDTPRLIGELAENVGFEYMEDVSLRARGKRWGQNPDRHNVPLAERLIVLKKRGGVRATTPVSSPNVA